MEALGYAGIVFLMFLENVFPPIPSELIMPFAGYSASIGSMTLFGVIMAGTIGSVAGALPLYYLGTVFDINRTEMLLKRFPWLMVKVSDVERAHRWFDRYGYALIFFGRMVPGIRSLISIPAGMNRMPLLPFLALTFVGSFLWSGLLAGAGFWLGTNFTEVEAVIAPISSAIIYVVAAGLLLFGLKRTWDFFKRMRS